MNTELYKKRRQRLVKSMPSDSVLILPSSPVMKYSGNADWPYRPSSNLIYFSGFEEPYACLIIKPGRGGREQSFLFVQKKDPKKAIWTGPVHGPGQAKSLFQVSQCRAVSEFTKALPRILQNTRHVYYDLGFNPAWDAQITPFLKRKKGNNFLKDPSLIIAPLRMQKDKEEIQYIKKAVATAEQAHIAVMKQTRPGINERALYGRFLFELLKRGAEWQPYTGIFASGPNACILHYTKNCRALQAGELMLVDAGAQHGYYASDITRTFPVSGKFSKTQKRLYTKLLAIQKNLIHILKPGLSFKEIQNKLAEQMSLLLREEGILTGSVKEIIQKRKYRKYFPHGFGHSLGLDVHDLVHPQKKDPIYLTENFVLTIEPGLYLPQEDTSLKPKLRGLGFRIEDDILITKDGAEVLSRKVPKEVEEIEELMSKK